MEYGLVALWLATYLSFLLAGVPVVAALCPRLADRGAGVALPAALAVVGYVAWVAGRVAFGWPALFAGLAALACLAAFAIHRGALDRVNRRAVGESLLVFSLAFLAVVAIRAVDPSVHATMGEKFLDFGLLKGLVRADTLPPDDVWFAGEPLRYYYGGHMLAALLARLTFTEARFAYNLALAGYFGTFVVAAYGLAGSVGAHLGASRTTAAALGAFFVGVASNLWTPLRLLGGVLPDGLVTAAATAVGVEGFDAATYDPVAEFTYWGASRVVPGTINEFPLFAYLNGDLHAHMMSTGFLLLAATLAYSYYRTPERERRVRWSLLACTVPLAAFLAVVNTWSFPTVFGVVWLAVTFAPADPWTLFPVGVGDDAGRDARQRSWLGYELRRAGGATAAVVPLVLGAVCLSLPFWLGAASGRDLALVERRSPLVGLLVVHGTFLLVSLPYLVGWGRRLADRRTVGLVASGGLFVASLAWLLGFDALLAVGPVAVGAWLVLRAAPRESATDRAGPGFAAVLMLAATGLVLLVELVYVSEEAGPGRFNTVFKTYAQVWALWAPATGAALGWFLAGDRPAPSLAGVGRVDRAAIGGVGLARVATAVLLVATAAYGGLAAADHFTA
jgi:YYY domain-containing protein